MDRMFGIDIYGSKKAFLYRYLAKPSYRFVMICRVVKCWLYYRFHPEHKYHFINTQLKPGYYDIDWLMLHGMFSLLRRYVEDELGGRDKLTSRVEHLQADHSVDDPHLPAEVYQSHADSENEVLKLYDWWMVERPADEARRDFLMNKVYGRERFIERETVEIEGMKVVHTELRDDDDEEASYRSELEALSEKIEREEQEMLHALIDLRRGLWT